MYRLKIIRNWFTNVAILNIESLPSIEACKDLSKAFEQGIYEGLVIKNKNIRTNNSIIGVECLGYFPKVQLLGIIDYYLSDLSPLIKLKNDLVFLSLDVSKCRNPEIITEFSNLKHLTLECKGGWNGKAVISTNAEQIDFTNETDLRIFDFKKSINLFYIRFSGNTKYIKHYNLGSAPNVRILDFMFMRNLSDFGFISSMHTLNYISFILAPKLETVPDISKLTQLKMITLDTCARLRDISAIRDNYSIESLYINKIQDIELIKPLIDHPSLKFICASFKSKKLREQAKELLGNRLKNTIHGLPTYTIGPDELRVEYP